jgi:hypothetical protein
LSRILSRRDHVAGSLSLRPGAEAIIIESGREDDLEQVSMSHVQAVIYHPQEFPLWMKDLASTVETGAFHIERAVLLCATPSEIEDWLESHLPGGAALQELRTAVKSKIIEMVERERAMTNASHFMLRVFTEAPTHRCGFHIDTVLPHAPTTGILCVFNGPGTEYVHPDNVTSMHDFYRHLSQRERLAKEMEKAWSRGDHVRHDEILDRIVSLDERPAFLLHPDDVRIVPTASIVAFKHVNVHLHWSDHPKALAWIHRSPMGGLPRLVVNVTAREPQVHGLSR